MTPQEEAKRRFRERNGYEYGSTPVTAEQRRAVEEAISTRDRSASYAGKDYMALVEEYKDAKRCTLVDAMMAINKKFPEAREAYIRKANPWIK